MITTGPPIQPPFVERSVDVDDLGSVLAEAIRVDDEVDETAGLGLTAAVVCGGSVVA